MASPSAAQAYWEAGRQPAGDPQEHRSKDQRSRQSMEEKFKGSVAKAGEGVFSAEKSRQENRDPSRANEFLNGFRDATDALDKGGSAEGEGQRHHCLESARERARLDRARPVDEAVGKSLASS
jgi:hypothetical protein